MNRTIKATRPRRALGLARLEHLESRQLLATFLVTTAADSGDGSLRSAIAASNLATGPDQIDFAIPGDGVHTIALASPLPTVGNPTVIDATTQPGYSGTPLVELDGANILDTTVTPPVPLANANGLVLAGGSSTVKGLAIDRFTGSGIIGTRDGNTIQADFLGTDPTGTISLGNGGAGVAFASRNNLIGGLVPADRNVISGNIGPGIDLGGLSSALPTNDLIEGNLIGTDVTGSADLGNAGAGVDIESSGNVVGGTATAAQNVIDFNGGPGVQVGDNIYVTNVIQDRIEGNSLYRNVGLGIDLGGNGVSPNFPNANFGPNGLTPYPSLTSAYSVSGQTMVEGTLLASPNTAYTIDFYANAQPDRTGFGQGEVPIFSKTYITNATGFVDTTTLLPNLVPVGMSLSATATDSNGNTSEFGFSRVVTATAEADLAVASFNPNPVVQAGQPQTFTYSIGNQGPSNATDVVFTDALPAGATLVSGSVGQTFLPAPVDGVITADLGSLASSTSTVVTLTYTIPSPGPATNVIKVSSDQPDPVPSNNSLAERFVVTPAASVDLSLFGVANPYPVQAGSPLTFTFIASNASPNPATGVVFTDSLPSGLNVQSVQSSQGLVSHFEGEVTVNLGGLAGGANATITIVAIPTLSGPIANFATLASIEPDLDSINNSTTVYSYVTPPPTVDVAVAISAAPQPAGVGLPFAYGLIVGNPGTAPATGVTLTDVLPDAATIASIRPSQGTYSLAGNVLTVHFGALAQGGLAEVTVTLVPGAPGLIVDQAAVVADQPEFNITNNFASLATAVAAQSLPPSVIDQKLTVDGNKITKAVLTFSEALDSNSASMIANYAVLDLGSNGSLSATGPSVGIASATYNSTTRSVTLTFKKPLSLGRFYKLVVNGTGSPGLVDTSGNVLDGENNGLQNGIYESLIGRGTKTRPLALQIGVPKPKPIHKAVVKSHHK